MFRVSERSQGVIDAGVVRVSNREHIQHSSNCDRERADHFVSVPKLSSINAEAQRRPERDWETMTASQTVRSIQNLAI